MSVQGEGQKTSVSTEPCEGGEATRLLLSAGSSGAGSRRMPLSFLARFGQEHSEAQGSGWPEGRPWRPRCRPCPVQGPPSLRVRSRAP